MTIDIDSGWILALVLLAGLFCGGLLHRVWPWSNLLFKPRS